MFSEEVLLALVEAGMKREDAYEVVQEHAMAAWEAVPAYERVAADRKILSL